MNKQQLAAKIWESANKMRSKIEANEYKDYILGFIFYKFLSDKEEKYLIEGLGYTVDDIDTVHEDDPEIVDNVKKNIGYFIDYNNLFSTWLAKGSTFDVSDVRDALSAFARLISPNHKKVFDGIFDTLQTGLSKLGDSSNSQTKAISDLIHLIKEIPMNGKQDYDVLGFIYEYLISNFAANAGKKAGEFYTPHEVSVLMSELVANHLKEKNEIQIYDPTSGSGSLLINIGKAVEKNKGDSARVKYYAQELKENTYNLTRMNLVMRGISPDNIITRNADTLANDWPYFEDNDPEGTYEPLYVDAVVSNPPYSQKWSPAGKDSDPRYAKFGLAPQGKADYAFLLHDLYHLKSDGIMTIVLPHGVLFRGNDEEKIRKNLIENNHIDAIIGLPPNIFFGTPIPTIVMVLKQKRDNTDVVVVDASKGFIKDGKNNKLRACDIKKITDAVIYRKNMANYSRVVSRDIIRKEGYNLNIPRYVDSSEKAEKWDTYACMFGGIPVDEIDDFDAYWDSLPTLKDELFKKINPQYCEAKTKSIQETVKNNSTVEKYIKSYVSAFEGFEDYLKKRVLENIDEINTAKEEVIIGDDIFSRIKDISLVDKYDTYQILDDKWNTISTDIEIIQTEGFAATKQVDPHMVIKTKKGKKQEVQEGWEGHIIPFDLVQKKYFANELAEIKDIENHIAQIIASYDELLEQLPEEEKDKEFVKEDGSAFVWAEVKTAIKMETEIDSILNILKKAQKLNNKEKAYKKQLKSQKDELHMATKAKIEGLTDEKVIGLLYEKWIIPLVQELHALPETIIKAFIGKLEYLVKKYSIPLPDIEANIQKAETELSQQADQLTGGDFDLKAIAELKKLLGGI